MSIDTIRQRLEKATAGPWDWEYGVSQRTAWGLRQYGGPGLDKYILRFEGGNDISICPDPEDDMDFIAHSRRDLEALVKVAEAAEAIDELRKQTRVPHTAHEWTQGWARLREALAELEKLP